jgi:hypothetical protein
MNDTQRTLLIAASRGALLLVALAIAAECGGGPAAPAKGPGMMTGAAGRGGRGGPGGPGAGGMTGAGTGTGGVITVITGNAGSGGAGVFTCTAGVQQAVITDCGYPTTTSNSLTATVFNESDVLRAIQPAGNWPNGVVRVFYNDEHALTLGVRSVVVKSASGTTTTDYPVSALPADPGSVTSPATGTNVLVGTESGLDASLRPMWPSLFITDITSDPSARSGDWQQGGRPRGPDAVYGTWKAAVRTVDTTVTPNAVTITPDADPAKNNWSLAGGDTPPSGLSNEGYGAEAVWNVGLLPGRSYRLQVIVHDGDQNKAGGDSGEACVLFCTGGCTDSDGCPSGPGTGGTCGSDGCPGGTGTAGSGGGVTCPSGYPACGEGGIDPTACPANTVCANGCCLNKIG